MSEWLPLGWSKRAGLEREEALAQRPPDCPACGGRVVELRGGERCTRCGLTLCSGCSGEAWPDLLSCPRNDRR